VRRGSGAEQKNGMVRLNIEGLGEDPRGASRVASLDQPPPFLVQLGHPRLRLERRSRQQTYTERNSRESSEHDPGWGKCRACDPHHQGGPMCVGRITNSAIQ
jgi:hypothetical protein